MEVVVLRSKQGMSDLAVKPVTHFPLLLDDMVRKELNKMDIKFAFLKFDFPKHDTFLKTQLNF